MIIMCWRLAENCVYTKLGDGDDAVCDDLSSFCPSLSRLPAGFTWSLIPLVLLGQVWVWTTRNQTLQFVPKLFVYVYQSCVRVRMSACECVNVCVCVCVYSSLPDVTTHIIKEADASKRTNLILFNNILFPSLW